MREITKSIIFFIFVTFIVTSCQKDDLDELNKVVYVRHEGADMPAYIYGNGSEKVFVIILHGGPGGSGLEYRSGVIKDDLEKKYAVVYFDQRNSGMSQGNYSKDKINVDIMVDDVVALTKVIKHKYGEDCKFFLMGHSWGGTLGTAVLLKGNNQEIFNGWIEVDGGHNLKGIYSQATNYFKVVCLDQINHGSNISYWKDILQKVIKIDTLVYNEEDAYYLNSTAFKAETKLEEDGVLSSSSNKDAMQSIANVVFRNNPLTVFWNGANVNSTLSDQGIWENLDYTNQLKDITIPSLILWGRYDLVIPPGMAKEAYNHIGSEEKELFYFEKSGHSPMVNEGELFFLKVDEFIQKHK